MTMEEILEDFPDLTREDVLTALEFSAEQMKRVQYVAA